MKFTWSKMLLASLAAGSLWSCAEGVGDINRVQPNYYSKQQFQGDWYYRQTVVDVPYENGWLFEGIAGDVEKIRWEIQEDKLIAYRRNELIPGANGAPDTGAPEFTPVAAWQITSHFDIVRDYNPSTGEQTNVITENTSDRPWYQRDYIRVDWSQNLIPNPNGLDTFLGMNPQTGAAVPIAMTGANYWVQDHEEANPDRFEMTDDYIGVVGKYNVEPDAVTCYNAFNDWWGGTGGNCGPTTIKIKSSFMKVDPERPAYEPLDYSDRWPLMPSTDANGDGELGVADRVEKKLSICANVVRSGGQATCVMADVACTPEVLAALNADPFYSEQFGTFTMDDCESAGPEVMSRFGYFRTQHITYDREQGHTEEGRINLINRWNIWKNARDAQGNPVPLAQRQINPVVYYLNADFPEDLYGAADEIGRQWNDAFKETVAALRGTTPDQVAEDVFVVKRNDCNLEGVKAYVSKTKGARAVADRAIGGIEELNRGNLEQLCAALEYNFGFHWQKNGDLRYSFVYWVDRPQLAGPLGFGPSYADPDTGELLNGTAYVYGAGVDTYAAWATDVVEFMNGRQDFGSITDGTSMREAVAAAMQQARADRNQVFPDRVFEELDRRASVYDRLPEGRNVPVPAGYYDARLARIKGTSLERELFGADPAMIQALVPGWHPGDPVTDEIIAKVSPANRGVSSLFQQQEKRMQWLSSNHCMLMQEMIDPAVIGLALDYTKDSGKSRDQIYRELREKIFVGVMLHEVGHTLGLRHNFQGSSDALNYFDEYWRYSELPADPRVARTDNRATEAERQTLDACVQRAEAAGLDLSTLECLGANQFKNSSIMDYGGRFNSDFAGVGKYDKAAIAFGYGGLVETFDPSVNAPSNLETLLWIYDYKKIPEMLGGSIEGLKARQKVDFRSLVNGYADNLVARSKALPQIDPTTFRCRQNCDYVDAAVVPYKWCSDEFSTWTLDCKTWDEGASQTEIIQSFVDQFRIYWPFYAFKRDRFNFNPGSYMNRIFSRNFMHFSIAFQHYYYYGDYYRQVGLDIGKDLGTASVKGLNLLAEVMQAPEAGWHHWCERDRLYIPTSLYDTTDEACGTVPEGKVPDVYVPMGVGKPFWLEFDDNYYYQPKSVGSYYEKIMAIQALTNSQAVFFRVDDDASNWSINYYRLFKGEMLNLLGGVISNDLSRFGGVVKTGAEGKAFYSPALLVDPETFGTGDSQDVAFDRVLPRTTYMLRAYSLLYGMAFLNSNIDGTMDFRNYFKVSLKGAVDDIDYSSVPPEDYVEVTDPDTHFTWRAMTNASGNNFGFQMVKDAKAILDDYYQPAVDRMAAATPGSTEYQQAKAEADYYGVVLANRFGFLNDVRTMQDAFAYSNPF